MNDLYLPILALAPQVWHAQWVNRQQLFSRLGRRHTVLYSTGGWYVWDRASDAWRHSSLGGRVVPSDNVWLDESPRWLMRWPRFHVLDQVVLRAQARRWVRWLERDGAKRFIAQICHPAFAPFLQFMRPSHVVYHVYDQYELMPGWTREFDEAERALLHRADLVFCASHMMAEALRRKVARKIEVLPNGANVDAFFEAARARQVPADLAAIPHPRIGWTGSIHPQIDFGLITGLARRRPGWHFVFVGNKVRFEDPQVENEYQRCAALPNVHFLGYKPHDMVPPYVAGMDTNMMCYRLSDETWIKANSPLKLYEYLAAGRPVVSVSLPSVCELTNVVMIADGIDAWELAIEEALQRGGRGTPDQRRAAAAGNSWDRRAEVLEGWLTALPVAESEAQSEMPPAEA